jgi:hypothetical protein
MEQQIYVFFPCPLCECLPFADIPSTPAPNSTLQHCYIAFIMLISWSRGRLGQLQKYTFPCQSGCKIRTGPHRPPQNAKFPANVNGSDITSSILHSDEVERALNWVDSLLAPFGWLYFGVGTTTVACQIEGRFMLLKTIAPDATTILSLPSTIDVVQACTPACSCSTVRW